MATPKISVWAFNEFAKFDALITKLGCKPVEAVSSYDRTSQVKRVDNELHFKHNLESFLNVLGSELDTVRASFFKKNGEIRKLEGKTIKFVAEGFMVVFNF